MTSNDEYLLLSAEVDKRHKIAKDLQREIEGYIKGPACHVDGWQVHFGELVAKHAIAAREFAAAVEAFKHFCRVEGHA